MMNAIEKRKFFFSRIMEPLAPYGYFVRKNVLWKCSLKGQYLIGISCDLTRFGDLNEIDIWFGSFYGPVERGAYNKKLICPGDGFSLYFYVRNQALRGVGRLPSISGNLPFERQVDNILPCFNELVLPLLQIEDDLSAYLKSAEKFLEMNIEAYAGEARDISVDELAHAYLSLNRPEDALRIVRRIAKGYACTIEYTKRDASLFLDPEKLIRHWQGVLESALELGDIIESGDWRRLEPQIKQKQIESRNLCIEYFHLKKSEIDL